MELHQQLQSRLGARGQNGTRASAHVTFQRTTSERKLFLCQTSPATVLFWLNCAYREFYQHVGPYTVPARAKKGRERARTSSGFSLRNRSSPQFLRRQLVPPSSSVHVSNAGPRSRDCSHRQRLRPVIHTLCSRGDNQDTVQPRKSARYRQKEPERRPASFPRAEKRHVCGRWKVT